MTKLVLQNGRLFSFASRWLLGRSNTKAKDPEKGGLPSRTGSTFQFSAKDIETVNEILSKLQGWSIKFILTEAGNVLLVALNVVGFGDQMIQCKIYKISYYIYSIARFSFRIAKDANEIELSEFNFDFDIEEPELGQFLLTEMEHQVKIVKNCTLKGSVPIAGREDHYIPFLKAHKYECFIEDNVSRKTLYIQKHFPAVIV
ncbi:MAG: hypothetical protein P4L51_23600 [Puia sp.]|nr:hypothetical protein [Puia sp.]